MKDDIFVIKIKMVEKEYSGIKVRFHMNEDELNQTSVIYLLKFPNGKYYVGQTNTKFGLISRIQSHCYESHSVMKKRNMYKDNIIKKYKQFDVFILRHCTLKNIDEFEMFYINILRRKIVNIEKGGCENKIMSDDTKIKISKKLKDYNKRHYKYRINVYDLQGNFIAVYNGINAVANVYGVSRNTVMNCIYQHRILLCKYQIFKEGNENIKNYGITEKGKKKKIIRFTRFNGKKIKIEELYKYNEQGFFVETVNVLNINDKELSYIIYSIKQHFFYKNFVWSLEKKDKIEVPLKRCEKVSLKLSRPILQLDDNLNIIREWKNVKQAGEYYSISHELIRLVCNRWRRHSAKYVWCYKDQYEWFKSMWNEKLVKEN